MKDITRRDFLKAAAAGAAGLAAASVLGGVTAFAEEEKEHHEEILAQGDVFVIDPIDGTTNFIKAYRPSVTSIGLLKDGKPFIDETQCNGCGLCMNVCPFGAIEKEEN